MSDIFVSYASEDEKRVRWLVEALERQNCSVWWDRRIAPGQSFDDTIQKEIAAARCVIVVWSRHSVNSEWVKNEATAGLNRGILVPVTIEPVDIPLAFLRTQSADLSKGVRSGEFDAFLEAVSDKVQSDQTTPLDQANARRPSRLPIYSASAILLLGLVIGAVFGFEDLWSISEQKNTLAVLPFRNLSPDPDQRAADGIPEEIRAELERVAAIRLISLESKLQTDASLPDIIEDLEIEYVIEGTFRRSARSMRVTTRLVAVEDGDTLWAEIFQERITDDFAGEIAIAVQTATAIEHYFGGTEAATPTPITISPPGDEIPDLQQLLEDEFALEEDGP